MEKMPKEQQDFSYLTKSPDDGIFGDCPAGFRPKIPELRSQKANAEAVLSKYRFCFTTIRFLMSIDISDNLNFRRKKHRSLLHVYKELEAGIGFSAMFAEIESAQIFLFGNPIPAIFFRIQKIAKEDANKNAFINRFMPLTALRSNQYDWAHAENTKEQSNCIPDRT